MTTSSEIHLPTTLRLAASLVLVALVLHPQTGCRREDITPAVTVPKPPAGVDDLNSYLEEVRKRYGLPGIAAAVFNSEGLLAVGAAGTRKVGSDVPLIYTDKLQIASIAKTMTATIIAQLIESGLLTWETTLGELYPELAATMHPEFRAVTVEMLLRHSAGIPRWMRHDTVFKEWAHTYRGSSNAEMRYAAVKHIISGVPESPPGSRYHYTNDAYLILGNICERLAKIEFEDLVSQRVFAPLGMTSFGLQEPWSDRSLNNPWGHVKRRDRFVPFPPGDPEDYGAGGIPFGTCYGAGVSGSVVELAQYGVYHLRGDLGLESNLSPAVFRRLHHAPPADLPPATQVSAAGFFNEGKVDADGRWANVQHWGYYARGRTLLWFTPQADVGAAILTNGTDEDEVKGMQPISEIAIALFKRYQNTLPRDRPAPNPDELAGSNDFGELED